MIIVLSSHDLERTHHPHTNLNCHRIKMRVRPQTKSTKIEKAKHDAYVGYNQWQCLQDSRLLYNLIREIKTWLNINYITVHNNILYISKLKEKSLKRQRLNIKQTSNLCFFALWLQQYISPMHKATVRVENEQYRVTTGETQWPMYNDWIWPTFHPMTPTASATQAQQHAVT